MTEFLYGLTKIKITRDFNSDYCKLCKLEFKLYYHTNVVTRAWSSRDAPGRSRELLPLFVLSLTLIELVTKLGCRSGVTALTPTRSEDTLDGPLAEGSADSPRSVAAPGPEPRAAALLSLAPDDTVSGVSAASDRL
jgi:hypothetical protein